MCRGKGFKKLRNQPNNRTNRYYKEEGVTILYTKPDGSSLGCNKSGEPYVQWVFVDCTSCDRSVQEKQGKPVKKTRAVRIRRAREISAAAERDRLARAQSTSLVTDVVAMAQGVPTPSTPERMKCWCGECVSGVSYVGSLFA